jgi:hypothetical protein
MGPSWHYLVLCIGQSDIRGVGLQVGSVYTGYYVSDSLTYVPSEYWGVGLQVYVTTVVNQTTIRSRPRRSQLYDCQLFRLSNALFHTRVNYFWIYYISKMCHIFANYWDFCQKMKRYVLQYYKWQFLWLYTSNRNIENRI